MRAAVKVMIVFLNQIRILDKIDWDSHFVGFRTDSNVNGVIIQINTFGLPSKRKES